ncbi:MAG TPA: tetratricopeptide repeat protein, partial [Chloroflexota bacterium]
TTPVPASRSPAPRADAPHNLPVQLTSFVGRQREKAEVRRLLESARLLTLTGPGGCGKTRLALAVAADMSPSNPDGVWLVELASLGDPTLVPAVVAATLGVQTTLAGRTVEALVAYLAPRRLLLVLDNCEHLLDACATLVDALLRRCPNLRVLATSREALRTPGEVVWLVPSLTLPDPRRLPPLDALVRYEAVQLFLERAAAADPTFAMTEAEAAAIAEVCYRLDGIPLAIELAAARVQAFSVAQIAARLDDCFHLLQGGSRIGLTRQQTMKATIAWSYDLLTDRERQLFRRLASFAGSFDLEAAERVCAGEGVESCDVLDLLARLIDKSLVVVERGAEAARYRLLEPIRQFAAEQLRMAGEEAATRGRHRAYYLELAETAEDMLHGAPQIHWLDRLEQEHDNLRAALAWSRAEDPDGDLALRFVAALYPFWHLRGHLSEGRQWIEAALRESAARRSVQQEAPDAGLQRARARALYALGALTAYQSDLAAAVPHLEASVDLYRALGDRRHAARAEVLLAGIHFYQGEHARAEAEARECVAALRELEDPWGLAWALFTLGDAVLTRDPAEARPLLEESLARYRETGDRWGIALALTSLGRVALYEGNSSAARGLIEEGLALRRATGQQWFIAISLASLGDVARYEGNADEAKTLYQESLDLFQRVGVKLDIAWSLYGLGCAAKMQGDLALAQTLFERSLALEREVGNSTHIPRCLIGLAGVAVDRATKQRGQGPALHAARLLGAAEASLVAQGLVLAPPDSVEHRRVVAAARDALGEEAYRGAHEEGRCAPLDRIVADALGKGLDALARSVDQWA